MQIYPPKFGDIGENHHLCSKIKKINYNMRKLLLFFVCFMASVMANAQYKVTSVDKSETKASVFHQVLETEKSVLVYCTFTVPEDDVQLYCLNRKLKAVKNNVNYKIINSVNFPIKDEAEPRWLCTSKKGQKFNYVLEFEKFDPAGGFDIIQDETTHEDGMMNIYGIHLEKIDPKDVIDTERFLDDGHVIYGLYKNNGETYRYYIKDGLMMTFYNTWYGKDLIINFQITNNSDHGVMLDLDKVRLEAFDHKGNPTELTRYTPESYDNRIESDRRWEARMATTSDASRMIESKIYHGTFETENEWGRIGFKALESIYKRAQDNRIDQYLKDHPNNNPKALRSNSIKAGESIVGFIPLKVKKKLKDFKIYMPMDDYEFLVSFSMY